MLFFSRFAKKRSVAARTAALAQASKPVCEMLESRQLLTGVPAAPSGLTATPDGVQVDISFTNNAAGADTLYVEISADNGTTWSRIGSADFSGAGTATFTDLHRYPGDYLYRAQAEDYDDVLEEHLTSSYSNNDLATIELADPTDMVAIATGTTVNVSFNNNAANAEEIVIERSVDGGTTWGEASRPGLVVGEVTFSDTGRYPGTVKYRAYVSVYDWDRNERDYSAYTSVGSATVAFNAPTGMTATAVSGDEIDLSFTNNAANAGIIYVERSDDGGATWSEIGFATYSGVGTATYADTNFDPGTYKYRARASLYNYDANERQYTAYTNVATRLLYDSTPRVMVEKEQDGSEDGRTPVKFVFRRSGTWSGAAKVYFTLGGSATLGVADEDGFPIDDADYTLAGSGAVESEDVPGAYELSFGSADFVVLELPTFNDSLSEGDESIEVEVCDAPLGGGPIYAAPGVNPAGLPVVADGNIEDLNVTLDPQGAVPTQQELNEVTLLITDLESGVATERETAADSLTAKLVANPQLAATYVTAAANAAAGPKSILEAIVAANVTFTLDANNVLVVHRALGFDLHGASSIRIFVYPDFTPPIATQSPGQIWADFAITDVDLSNGRGVIPEQAGDSVLNVIIQFRDNNDGVIHTDTYNLLFHANIV